MSLNKSFKQEVESHPWAVNHNVPKVFLHGLAAVSVSLLPFLLALPRAFFFSFPEWERVEMLKT